MLVHRGYLGEYTVHPGTGPVCGRVLSHGAPIPFAAPTPDAAAAWHHHGRVAPWAVGYQR